MSFNDVSVLDIPLLDMWDDDVALAMRYQTAFRMDKDFRDEHVDYDKIACIYGRTSKDTNDEGSPHINLIRQMIHGFLGVLLPNIPSAKLIAERDIDPRLPEVERDIRSELLKENEEVNNALVESVLFSNDYRNERNKIISQSAIFGVGFGLVEPDYDLDPRNNEDARDLVERIQSGEIDEEEAQLRLEEAARINMQWVDTRNVYLEYGRRQFDANMTRCSYVEYVDSQSLDTYYDEDVTSRIGVAGSLVGSEIDDEAESDYRSPSTPIVTFWELEPITYRIGSIVVNDWFLVRVKVAGSAILEKEIYTRKGLEIKWEGSSFKTIRGAVRLPLVPFYVYEDTNHPFGYSMVLAQELHEEAYNRTVALMFAFADRQLQNGKVFYNRSALGPGDADAINHGLKNDNQVGIGLTGSEYDEDSDIRKMVQVFPNVVPQVPASLMSFSGMLLQQFQLTGSMEDTAAMARTRSGSGKRAQLAASDRPKILSIENLLRSIEQVYQAVYDNIRAMYNGSERVSTLISPGGQRRQVIFNQSITEPIPVLNQNDEPVFNPAFRSNDNVLGEVPPYPAHFVVNSTDLPMRAVADGRTSLPQNMVEKLQVLSLLLNSGAITPETFRNLGLDKSLKDIDDSSRRKAEGNQQLDDAAINEALNALGVGGNQQLGNGVPPSENIILEAQQDQSRAALANVNDNTFV